MLLKSVHFSSVRVQFWKSTGSLTTRVQRPRSTEALRPDRFASPINSVAVLVLLSASCFTAALPAASPLQAANQAGSDPMLKAVRLRVEYKTNPLGIDVQQPRLSWQIQASGRGVMQTAYQVRVALSEPGLNKELVWDSGQVRSEDSIQRVYGGPSLLSGQRYHWQVRIWDGNGRASAWSAPAYWEMGLLKPRDWQAGWIESALPEDLTRSGASPLLRREFRVKGVVARARAYVTSHGLYEMYLNGRRIGEDLFMPGWTSYNKRLQYQTYDVTDDLKNGDNAVGVMLGDGWYRGYLVWEGNRNVYGDKLSLLLQIRVTYKDGREETIGTDQNWKASTGPILMSDIYDGEIYDARLEKTGWTSTGFDDRQWSTVKIAEHTKEHLVAQTGPPVRRIQEIKPVKIFKTPEGDTVADLGQNMVGWLKIKAEGAAGTTITLRHAEVLDLNGNFYTDNLRKAKATARYTLKGSGVETFEPTFTFMGFRYVAIDGYPGEVKPDSLTGVVIHSDMTRTGEFETSSALINQLQHNILWGQKGNFLDVPTDCPQRDERLGWTGDAQVFARTAAFNMDVAGFFTKWLKDLAADQLENGSVPHVIPDVISKPGKPAAGSAAWADAATIIPWTMYLSYGDKRILEQQYESMTRWVEYVRSRAGQDLIWDRDSHFGDWLAFASYGMAANDYPGATTGKDLIATAFFAYSTSLVHRVAHVLGKREDATKYGELLTNIKQAFRREFVTESGRVGENTQTAYVLALHFDLLPEKLRPLAARKLAEEVRFRKHLTTGFVGTPYLCHVLSRYGYLNEAYLLLKREEYPSWLYPVKQGATTIWERWDGQRPDGTFQTTEMNSFNHYAYGAIGEWMYRVMAGIEIDPALPGYKRILIQPQPGGGFTRVAANHDTMHGRVRSAWEIQNNIFELAIEVPANTRASVRLPKAELGKVTESGKALSAADGVSGNRQEGDSVVVEVASGNYKFRYPMGQTSQASAGEARFAGK